MNLIRYSQPSINRKDRNSVLKVLQKKFLTQGYEQEKFENELKKKLGLKYCCAVSNASNGLILGLKSLGIKKGDIIWTSNITFCSNLNSALHLNCKVKLIDISKNYPNITFEILKNNLIKLKKKQYPKVIIVTHMGGIALEMRKIFKLSKKYKFKILEDASHALGAKYECGSYVGTCKYSDATVFSMHAIKIITTGEGGIVSVKNKKKLEEIKKMMSHYISREKKNKKKLKNYDVTGLGYNYRLTDFQAALGTSQLKRLKTFHKKRVDLVKYYTQNISLKYYDFYNKNIENHAWHLFILKLREKYQNKKLKLINYLHRNKIETRFHYIPNNMHSYYKDNKNVAFEKEKLQNSENYFKSSFSIPIHPDLKKNEQRKIVKLLNSFFD